MEFACGGVGLEDTEAVKTGWSGVGHTRLGNSVADQTRRAAEIVRVRVCSFWRRISELRREILLRQG
jgi:hypothetical protein